MGKLFIKTFGCQQNVADSQRIASYYVARGYEMVSDEADADLIVINSCMIREKAEERVYGYIRNLRKKRGLEELRIVLTGCIVGAAAREPSGKMKKKLEKRIPDVELLSIDEVGFEYPAMREKMYDLRGTIYDEEKMEEKSPRSPFSKGEDNNPAFAKSTTGRHGWVVISNGCNNYCTFCIVPYSRGKEVSRPYGDILDEVREMVRDGYSSITLLGQNVNSYGTDLVRGRGTGDPEKAGTSSGHSTVQDEKQDPLSAPPARGGVPSPRGEGVGAKEDSHHPSVPSSSKEGKKYVLPNGKTVSPVMVKHLGRHRIPTLFPYLLEDVAQIPGVEKVTFTSSNPWDFSEELIDVIARNKNIDRLLHLPVQSGSDRVLRAMNRWYTAEEYLALLARIVAKIPESRFITDIIVGFPGETEEDFEATVDLSKRADFVRAFIGCYSPRPGTKATKEMADVIEWKEKKRRMHILNDLINKTHQGVSEGSDWIRTGGRKEDG